MICRTCNGSGRMKAPVRNNTERTVNCMGCDGHGEIYPQATLARCFECNKPLSRCKCDDRETNIVSVTTIV